MDLISKRYGAACLLAAAAACAPQANEEYLGEPLLRMRGSVATGALTTTQPIVPALCFYEDVGRSGLRYEQLPAEIQAAFENSGKSGPSSLQVHILDVQAHGQFPAEFKVDVYSPPAEEAIEPYFTGEPRMAFGSVCAVQVEHKPVGQWVSDGVIGSGQQNGGPCSFTRVMSTRDGSRAYWEQLLSCPTVARENCQERRGGDETLLAETGGFEDVVAIDDDGVEVIYLADPAPPDSYTAYRLGAPEGLSAGYHLRKHAAPAEGLARVQALTALIEEALDRTNALYGTGYASLPSYWSAAEPNHEAPPEVVDTYKRILARLEMENIPITIRTELAPNETGLTLNLEPRVWTCAAMSSRDNAPRFTGAFPTGRASRRSAALVESRMVAGGAARCWRR